MPKNDQALKLEVAYRTAKVHRAAAFDEDARTVELAFSSDEPYERPRYIEILDHAPGSVNLGRLKDRAALLVEHDPDRLVGSVEDAWLDEDGTGRAKVRLGRGSFASEVWQDIKDGIRGQVSVGYFLDKPLEEIPAEEKGGKPTIRFAWEPFEISLVSIAADPHRAGVGRGHVDQDPEATPENAPEDPGQERTNKMPENVTPEAEAPQAPAVDIKAERETAAKAEQDRITEILAIGRKYDRQDMANQAIKAGTPLDAFRQDFLASFEPPVAPGGQEVGLSDRETREFSLMNVVRALADPRNRSAQEAAAFEFDACAAAAEKAHRAPEGVFVPAEVMRAKARRDITVGTGGTGQYLVDTNKLSMVERLENAMLVRQMGATVFSGLTGDLAFPRHSTAATSYWVGEGSAVTESTPAFQQVNLSPKTAGAFTDLTRKTILQSSLDIENWLRNELAFRVGLAVDAAAINGSGSANQPLGILNTTGIGGSAVGGAAGAAPDYADICTLEGDLGVDNALRGRLAFLTNEKVRNVLRQTAENSSVPNSAWVYTGGAQEGRMLGYPAFVSNQVPSNLVKGGSGAVCSAIIFGNFLDLYIGMWGPLDINVDRATLSSSGGVRVVALQDCDVALAHPESFAAMQDATTTL